jgi:selenide,water dikinase
MMLERSTDPNLLVGLETSDDAGVYRLTDECALVETADIITPLVDDPFTFGRIAATNALSDVYAMGGRPVTATNLVFFPACALPVTVLADLLAGGQAALTEAGCCLVGGHTVEDDEFKYGLAVTGVVHPQRVVRNSTARAGDRLILTKPLGTGIVTTAIKADLASAGAVAEATRWMTTLNRRAAELMLQCGVAAATDITGFGLVGHASEMARGAGVTIQLDLHRVPLMAEVPALVDDGMVPAGCYRNRDHYRPLVAWNGEEDALLPLFDPQTSGGLLMTFASDDADRFLAAAEGAALFAVEVGTVTKAGAFAVVIV